MMRREELTDYLDDYLNANSFEDYGPNGLQIEGQEDIRKLAFAVSATAESVNKAVEAQCSALIVHHGVFWKKHGARTITGPFKKRVAPLVERGINLYGYHLPLDAHPEVGNAASLGRALKLGNQAPFGDYCGQPLGIHGQLPNPLTSREFQRFLEKVLNHAVIHSNPPETGPIEKVGVITGGAGGYWEEALALGRGASFVTGEISEHHWHESREAGIHLFAGGHHATEIFGVLALKEHLEKKWGLEGIFIDSDNPA